MKKIKKKAEQPSSKPRSPVVAQLKEYHRQNQELFDELERNRPHVDDLVIDGLATFKAHFEHDSHAISNYQSNVDFQGVTVNLVVYPTRNGNSPSGKKLEKLKTQFFDFSDGLDSALETFPEKLRKLCKSYGIDAAEKQDDCSLIAGIKWQNVKLESWNWIECYTHNHSVTEDFDIVIRFKRKMFQKTYRTQTVYFDG